MEICYAVKYANIYGSVAESEPFYMDDKATEKEIVNTAVNIFKSKETCDKDSFRIVRWDDEKRKMILHGDYIWDKVFNDWRKY